MNDALLEMEEHFRHEETHTAHKRIKEIKMDLWQERICVEMKMAVF
jgi:hypothetical protein